MHITSFEPSSCGDDDSELAMHNKSIVRDKSVFNSFMLQYLFAKYNGALYS
jgi:hypothetical protein